MFVKIFLVNNDVLIPIFGEWETNVQSSISLELRSYTSTLTYQCDAHGCVCVREEAQKCSVHLPNDYNGIYVDVVVRI